MFSLIVIEFFLKAGLSLRFRRILIYVECIVILAIIPSIKSTIVCTLS